MRHFRAGAFVSLLGFFLVFCPVALKAVEKAITWEKPYFGIPIEGTVEDFSPENLDAFARAGTNYVDVHFWWPQYEPDRGVYNREYVERLKSVIEQLAGRGWRIGLRMAWHYPPKWAFDVQGSRFINQYGDIFGHDQQSGYNVLAIPFNQELRDRMGESMSHFFSDLGPDCLDKIAVVTIGGGYYGEVNYPGPEYSEKKNCYWAYSDEARSMFSKMLQAKYNDIASLNKAWGTSFGSFEDVKFVPGQKTGGPPAARDFLEWYLETQKDYVLWQHGLVRKSYGGYIAVLCGSWGVRDGALDKAVAAGLDGSTPAEATGEISQAFDFSRYFSALAGTGDKKIIVQSTWVDSSPDFSGPGNPAPVEWLAGIAHEHGFLCAGEFTDSSQALSLGAERMLKNELIYLVYVPPGRLRAPEAPSMQDWADMIQSVRKKKGN